MLVRCAALAGMATLAVCAVALGATYHYKRAAQGTYTGTAHSTAPVNGTSPFPVRFLVSGTRLHGLTIGPVRTTCVLVTTGASEAPETTRVMTIPKLSGFPSLATDAEVFTYANWGLGDGAWSTRASQGNATSKVGINFAYGKPRSKRYEGSVVMLISLNAAGALDPSGEWSCPVAAKLIART